MNDMLIPKKRVEATRLTRAGRLAEATALLQRMFRGATAPDIGAAGDIAASGRKPPIVDAKAAIEATLADATKSAQPHMLRRLGPLLQVVRRSSGLGLHGLRQPAP